MGVFGSPVFGSEDGPVFGGAGRAVAPIDPYGIASMILGYDWRRTDLITDGGTPNFLISSIADTENARALVQTTDASKPIRGDNTGFVFDGGADTAAYLGGGGPSGTADWHAFMVAKDSFAASDANFRYAFGWGGSGQNFSLHIGSARSSGIRRGLVVAGTGSGSVSLADTAVVINDGAFHLWEAWGSGGVVHLRIDEVPEVSVSVAYSITASGRIRMAGQNMASPAATSLWGGGIGLVNVFNAIQTGDTLAGLRQYYRNAVTEIST